MSQAQERARPPLAMGVLLEKSSPVRNAPCGAGFRCANLAGGLAAEEVEDGGADGPQADQDPLAERQKNLDEACLGQHAAGDQAGDAVLGDLVDSLLILVIAVAGVEGDHVEESTDLRLDR